MSTFAHPLPTRAGRPLVCLVAVAGIVAGCGSSSERAAGDTARAFERALTQGHADRACALLSDRARSELEQSSGKPCAESILEEGRREAGRARAVSVHGSAAQAVFDDDTLFLSRYDDGWRVTAAACEPTPAGRYDCVISGG